MTRRPLCANPGLLTRIAIVERRNLRFPEACEEPASRLVEVTRVAKGHLTGLRAEVCLWHSLVAVERLDARLIRVTAEDLVST